MQNSSKIFSRDELRRRVAQWRRAGERIILTNGCFDLLHVGHVRSLRAAKALGGRVIVAVNSDRSARALKGRNRPVVPQRERAEVLAALGDVDGVVIFGERDVTALIRELRPDIHAKGTDYRRGSVPERDVVVECGGQVAIVGDRKRHSASALISKLAGKQAMPARKRRSTRARR